MKEGWSFEAVGGSTGSFHSICHPRRPTREDTNLGKMDVLFLEDIEELVEVGTTEVGDSAKTCEQTLAGQLLEITLANVLRKQIKQTLNVSY